MPTRYKRKKYVRRRKNYRKKKIPLPLNGFPDTKVARHRYVHQFKVGCTGNTQISKSYQFVANGMYDPDPAVGGQQPKGFDEMMNIYNHYHVIGSKAKVRLVQSNIDSTESMMWGVKLTDTRSVAGYGPLDSLSLEDIVETKGIKMKLLNTNSGYAQPNTANQVITQTYSPTRVHGKAFTMTDRNQGDAASNPSEATYFEIVVVPTLSNVSAVNQDQYFIVSIDYIVVYSERKLLARS